MVSPFEILAGPGPRLAPSALDAAFQRDRWKASGAGLMRLLCRRDPVQLGAESIARPVQEFDRERWGLIGWN